MPGLRTTTRRQAARALAGSAPELLDAFEQSLPRAQTAVATRLAEALWREDIGDARRRFPATPQGFDRVELAPVHTDPVTMVEHPELRAELDSAVIGLALAYARREALDTRTRCQARHAGAADMRALLAGADPDEQTVRLEQLATEGHNLHPCGRTRLGWSVPDLLAHDLESEATGIGFVSLPADLVIGDDLGERLGVAAGPGDRRVVPLHGWQLGLVRERYADLVRDGVIVVLDEMRPARPSAALRTLLTPGAGRGAGAGGYLKLSLDIQVTSTRRSISIASTRNGPAISAVLARLVDADPDGGRVLLMPEVAGVASPIGSGRDLSAIVRTGLSGRLAAGELPVPGSALAAVDPVSGRMVLADLVDRFALTRGVGTPAAAALAFLDEYARLLLPPVLRLASYAGIGLEAHLQNCVPTFVEGVPTRMGLRDFAGLRLHTGRLARAEPALAAAALAPVVPSAGRSAAFALWPGSVVGTGDESVLLSKVAYTAFQAHLGELVLRLGHTHGLAGFPAWRAVRAVVDEVLLGHPDHAYYTAPTVPHKALTRMRLAGAGDVYVPVHNPLHAV